MISLAMSLDQFFAIIKNGTWHTMDELAESLELPTDKLTRLAEFLSEHGLVDYDDEAKRAKIRSIWKLLLPKDDSPEPKTTVATLVIPPKTSIMVQSTRISNLSNVELEIDLRVDDKIKEVAIKS